MSALLWNRTYYPVTPAVIVIVLIALFTCRKVKAVQTPELKLDVEKLRKGTEDNKGTGDNAPKTLTKPPIDKAVQTYTSSLLLKVAGQDASRVVIQRKREEEAVARICCEQAIDNVSHPCWICFEEKCSGEWKNDELIVSPCKCKGTSSHVHVTCLSQIIIL